MSVYTKLQMAKVKLQELDLKKSGRNTFAGYNYFELGDFLPQINLIFSNLGLCSVVSFDKDTATLRIIDTDDLTETVITSPMAEASLKGCHPIQNIGAVQTYSRRYLYMAALDIAESEPIDSASPTVKKTITPTTGAKERLEPEQRLKVEKVASEVLDLMAEGMDLRAYERAEGEGLDADEKVYFWTMFDSKQRRKLKDINELENQRKAKTAPTAERK